MAAPSYTTDLITLTTANTLGNWDESSDAAWDDAGSMVAETNFYIQNVECISAQFTKDGVGTIIYGHGSSVSVPTDGAVLIWHFWASPPSLATLANGGVRAIVGNGYGDFKAWDCSGSDFEPSPLGGWYNFAVDPSLTADDTVGTVASPYSHFGMAVSATAQARGNPNAVDAIRYGRCTARYNGGDSSNGYATFSGFAAVDDSSSNRWALLSPVPGGYRWQGLMLLGYSSAVDFRDSNKSIIVANTINVSTNFNKIEIAQATSNVEWTNISILSTGTVSKGKFEMTADATVVFNGCVFTDMDTFIFDSNADIQTTTFRRCGQITQAGGSFTDCIIEESAAAVAMSVDTLGNLDGCKFTSDGTGHAVDLGTISSGQSMTWDNIDSGYASSNGSTGNETILVNVASGVTLTINVSATATTPTYYNTGTGTVSVVAGQKTFSFTLNPSITGYEWRIYSVTAAGSLAGATELDGEETATADNQSYAYSYTSDTPIAVQIIDDDYEEDVTYYTLKNSDQPVTINLSTEENV